MADKDVVLVVEDELLVRNSVVLELEDAGFDVITAENGDEASQILPKMPRIDLLLTDIRMPGRINGWVLADMARCRRPNLPVIYTSAFASAEDASKVEGSFFLSKPYRIGEILSAMEELKSTKEQLSPVDAEPQSADEDVETTTEKLQSLNEQLQKANAKLKARVDELSRANSDLVTLLSATEIAAIILDRNLVIERFTPAAQDVFDLVESDIGRPMSQISSRLGLGSIQKDAEHVLRTHGVTEARVESNDGSRRYIMTIRPYSTHDNVIRRVVIVFVDVTRITAAAAETFGLICQLRDRVAKMERILDVLPAGIFITGNDPMQNVQANRYGIRLLGEIDDQEGPRDVPVPYRLFNQERELAFWEQPLQRAAFTGRSVPATRGRLVRRDGSSVEVMMWAEPLLDELGSAHGAVAVIIDATNMKAS